MADDSDTSIHGDTDEEESIGSLVDFIDDEDDGEDVVSSEEDDEEFMDDADTATSCCSEIPYEEPEVATETAQEEEEDDCDGLDPSLILPSGTTRTRRTPTRYVDSHYLRLMLEGDDVEDETELEEEEEQEEESDAEDGDIVLYAEE